MSSRCSSHERPWYAGVVLNLALALATACSGSVQGGGEDRGREDDGNGDDGGDGSGSTMPPPVDVVDDEGNTCTVRAGLTPLRRLSNLEYRRTVDDLFAGVGASAVTDGLVGDNIKHFFDNNAAVQTVLVSEAEAYLNAAERISEQVGKKLSETAGCAKDPDDACVKTYLSKLAFRAFRRPLTEGESAAITSVYDKARERLEVADAARAGVEFILQAPQFLYRPETALEGGSVERGAALSGWDIASRLSYFLWASMPDDELFEAAEKGELDSRDQVRAQARRLLDSPKALDSMHHFFAQWTYYKKIKDQSKNQDLFPDYTPQVVADMIQESETLIDQVVKGEAGYKDLFSGHRTFRNGRLNKFYEGRDEGGASFEPKDLDPERSAGLLTQGSLLAALSTADDSSPIFRGHFVRTHLLCDELPLPPDDVPPLPPIDDDATVRTIHEMHMEVLACKGCHLQMDPIGFALENYDSVGVWRDTYRNGKPVDAQGEIHPGDEPRPVDGPVNGPGELGRKLAGSEAVRQCMARQLFEYALGRSFDNDLDACTVKYLSAEIEKAEGRFDEMVVSLVTSDSFMRTQKSE